MNSVVDLHIHSNLSDGEYTIDKLIDMILKEKIDLFSITDHDNIDSINIIKKMELNNDYITGVELSSCHQNINCHILGYNIDEKSKCIIDYCNYVKSKREKRMYIMLDKLIKSYDIKLNDVELELLFNKVGCLGKPDLLKILLDRNLGTKKHIYDNYLKNIDTDINYRLDATEAISAILGSGGIPILAHPKEIQNEYNIDIFKFTEELVNIGLSGIEIYNSIHDLSDLYLYKNIANKLNLLFTGGSDYHGPVIKSKVNLGHTTKNKIKIYKKNINL